MHLLDQHVPEVIDAEKLPSAEVVRFVIVDPWSRRELALVKACHTVDGWIEFYKTQPCTANDPECIRYDGHPIMRRFAGRVRDAEDVLRVPTYRKRRSFDVVERASGAVLKQVRV